MDDDCFDYIIETGYENCTLQKRWCPRDLDPIPENSMYAYIDPKCKTFFNLFNMEDWAAGILLLFISLFTMILALLFMVKLLSTLLKGKYLINIVFNFHCH